jgi:aminoglycoside phosphotransferase (APT) family kinase protein
MESRTKTKLTRAQITALTQRAFGAGGRVANVTELTDGFFNTAYKVDLRGGETAVLKISPPSAIPVMRYEHNLMAVEAAVLQRIAALSEARAPKLHYYGRGDGVIANDYFFMEFIPGVSLNKQQETLTAAQSHAIFSALGAIARTLAAVRGPYFGHILQPDRQFADWPAAFLTMIQDLLADAADAGVTLPMAPDAIYRLVAAQRQALDAPLSPALVHKDLWPGNVFVDPATAAITGIVDFERAIYGDPLLEPVCGFLLENQAFMHAYLGRAELTPAESVRVTLYKIYLFLIMVIECPYRRYPDDRQEKWAREQLRANLARLTEFSSTSGKREAMK